MVFFVLVGLLGLSAGSLSSGGGGGGGGSGSSWKMFGVSSPSANVDPCYEDVGHHASYSAMAAGSAMSGGGGGNGGGSSRSDIFTRSILFLGEKCI